jgi:ribosome-associated protein
VSTAVHLRFDVRASTLPDFYKERLFELSDQRINEEGVIVIKAQRHRSREDNKEDACNRLVALIKQATAVQKKRRPTKPSKSAKKKRVDGKTRRGKTKSLRGKIDY